MNNYNKRMFHFSGEKIFHANNCISHERSFEELIRIAPPTMPYLLEAVSNDAVTVAVTTYDRFLRPKFEDDTKSSFFRVGV
jgi:hypothetical protein